MKEYFSDDEFITNDYRSDNETSLPEENLYSYILIDRMYQLFLNFVVSDLCIKTQDNYLPCIQNDLPVHQVNRATRDKINLK